MIRLWSQLLAVVLRGRREGDESDRGDVPGWVLVTVMTAGLVVALLAIAQPQLTSAFTRAVRSVTGG